MVTSPVKYWLALKYVPRLSFEKKLNLVQRFGLETLFLHPPSLSVLGLSPKQIAAIVQPDWRKIENIMKAAERCHCYMLGFDDIDYPTQLKEIYDPPFVLFVQGSVSLLSANQIAIVGSRSATVNGKENTKLFTHQLTQYRIVITSGLAIGIDGCAHKAALDCGGKTIAVVATGLDTVYPTRHKVLAKGIIDNGGAIVSEFVPGTLAKPGHFPKRNRIISGLSKGVLVVEAEIKSGSLITARMALEQNREVFAIPGNILSPQSKGCHYLIKEGAKLVDDIADIVNELDLGDVSVSDTVNSSIKIPVEGSQKSSYVNENNTDKSLFIDSLLASVGDEITPIDVVVLRSGLPISEVLNRLTMLELKGLVLSVPGGYQRLIKR